MALVDYSGSESSDGEEKSTAKQTTKPKVSSNKPAFQKVVDRADPHKIRVNLIEASKPIPVDDESARASKRVKLGSGAMSGFNALLPTPKRATAPNGGVSLGGARKGGLGSGVNLRTGATPGFSREPEPNAPLVDEVHTEKDENTTHDRVQNDVAEISTGDLAAPGLSNEGPTEETKPKGKVTMFKPLSVARKPQKKKPPLHYSGDVKSEASGTTAQPKSRPKVSLFSTGETEDISRDGTEKRGAYQPMVYHSSAPDPTPNFETPETHNTEDTSASNPTIATNDAPPQSLDTIASDLNLSKSAKRQLLGRQKNNASAVNIVNFNTDEEYQANEDIRKSGEQIQHNAVRSIAPGKHSLKQLVNMGTGQADALEESFASGRRNRSEAGSKYGW